jgi:orsellinic acid C2-O-methyltransferase
MTTQELPPPLALFRMATSYYVSQAIYAVAQLGVADLLGDGLRGPDELAKATGTNADALRRVLRLLASLGVFTEEAGGEFAPTPIGTCLRSGVPGSMDAVVLLFGGITQQAWGDLMHSLRGAARSSDEGPVVGHR